MNNFAISSDGIATALQDSASSLMAANNSYQEAVALIAAANRVVQDPNSVGAALRTISLRLRGTSVKELEEQGEDTTGAVESTSKLRSKVKALSGVDILTDTGAYKDTYTVLLEISEVWEKMSDIDQAALLELLAGKTRSNTLAAILGNPEDLKDAYETAMGADGSALRENEKYLDSIQGKIDQFNNAVQTMWSNILSSDVIKAIVSHATKIIQSLDTAPGKIMAIVKAVALLMAYKKVNPLDWLTNISQNFQTNGVVATLKNMALSLLGIQTATKAVTAETLANTIATETNDAAKTKQMMTDLGLVGTTGALDAAKKKEIATTILQMMTTGKLTMAQGNAMLAMLGYAGATVAADGSLKLLDATTKSFMATNPVGLILAIISVIASLVMWMSTLQDSTEKVAEKANEALSEYENATKTLRDHQKTIEDISGDYKKLARGVDDLGNNISLTAEEFSRYNDITNQIADMFPEMVSGFTDEGNAIIALKGNVDVLKKAYEEEAQAAREAMIANSETVYDDFKNNFNKEDNWFQTANLEEARDITDTIQSGLSQGKTGKEIADMLNSGGVELGELKEVFDSAGIKTGVFDDWGDMPKYLTEENLIKIQSYYKSVNRTIQAETAKLKPVINAWLNSDENYNDLSDDAKNIAQQIINGFSAEFYGSDEFESFTDIYVYIQEHILEPLQDSVMSADLTAALEIKTKFQTGEVDVFTYQQEINELISNLEEAGVDTEVIQAIKVVFEVDVVNTQVEALQDLYGDEIKAFDKEEIRIAYNIVQENGNLSFEELETEVAKQRVLEIEASIDLESFNKEIDSIQEAYSTLTDVVKQYNDIGYLTLDNLQALLSLEPKYLALLQMENGQLSINQAAMEEMVQAKLAEAKANVITSTIKQLDTLATNAQATAIATSTGAASGSIGVLGQYAGAISKVGQEALLASGEILAFKAAIDGAETAGASEAEINNIISNMNAQLAMIDSLGANLSSNFGNIVSPSSSSGGKTALEKIKEKYERKIKNLEGQQTYLENEIEKLEAQDEGVSADYYEKQIALEEEKLSLYEQEREELLKLKRTDEVADALWEVEHAIQESTLRMIEFRKSIAELYATASDKITEAYDREQQLYSDRTSFIENEISIRETKGELVPTSAYDELIAEAVAQRTNAEEELNAQANLYWQGINNGDLEEGSEEALDILEQIRQKRLDIQEYAEQEAQWIEAQKDAYIEYYDKMMEMYNHRNDFFSLQSDFAQSYINRLDVLEINVPDEAYEKIADIQKLSIEGLKEQLEFANSELANFKENNIDENDPRYIEKLKEAFELEEQLYEAETQLLEYQQQIFDNQIDRFNQVIDRINDATQKLQNVSGLLERNDVATEDGEWTAEGLTRLGMNYQQMEYYKQSAEEIAEKMAEVEEAYQNGEISEKKYYETMQALSDQQWDAINSYEDMKDSIVELNEARIDMIEEGLNKEIEAYQELIDLKKEELDAERDLYDFKKNVEKQTKDIAALERRIASMSGSTDASTIAERTKLEAELRDLKDGLNDTYYSHATDSQSKALDDELEALTKSSEDYIESLRESIEDIDLLIETTFKDVMQNGQIVLETLTNLSGEYGFNLEYYLTEPWENATYEALDFESSAISHFNAVYEAVETKTSELTGYTKAPWKEGRDQASLFSTETQKYMGNIVTYAEEEYKTQLLEKLDYPWLQANGQASWGDKVKGVLDQAQRDAEEAGKKIAESLNVDYTPPSYEGTSSDNPDGPSGPGVGSYIKGDNVKNLQKILNKFFKAKLTVDGSYGPATKTAVTNMQKALKDAHVGGHITINGEFDKETKDALQKYLNKQNVSSWFKENKVSVPAAMYAKGTLGTKKDELAITDESWIGEEITLGAGKTGHLQYLRKGSAVMPADISENLMEWGSISPKDLDASGNSLLIKNHMSQSDVDLSLNIDGLTKGDALGLGETGVEYLENLNESITDLGKLVKNTSASTVNDTKNTFSAVQGIANSYELPLSTSLTSPWLSATQKSNDFEISAKLNYDNLTLYVDGNKDRLEEFLKTPYQNLTGDQSGNEVYEFSEYAKTASVDDVISYADLKREPVKTSLSNGFNDAQSSVTAFKDVGTAAIDILADKFTNKETGLIKVLNDTEQAAKAAATAVSSVPSYSGGPSNTGGADLNALGGAVVPSYTRVSSQYGYRIHPITKTKKFHSGTDFAAPGGTPINAYADGVVSMAGWNGGYGNCVIIDHGDGHQTLYAHASALHVSKGATVKGGQRIASVGTTGTSTGNHLHFEYRVNGKSSSPANLPKFAKGTLGTTKDQFAITDESWIGEEITLAAGKNGQLQYLKKGSAVLPSEIAANLVEWGKLNPNMMSIGDMSGGIQLMSNYVNKPELNVSFDSLVHVDHCDQGTLKDLEKMVDNKIDQFSRQMNYAIKRFK